MKKILAILLIVLISGCVGEQTYRVIRIIDGDTFEISTGEHVRMQGIDAPDKNDHYYEEATERLRELIGNTNVKLEKDQTDKDHYGRLLRYVYLGNKMINSQMVEEGCASVFIFEADRKYEKVLTYAENYAKTNRLGIWNTPE